MSTPAPELTHADWCVDRTVRETESIFDRGVIRYRCLGCGAETTRRRPGPPCCPQCAEPDPFHSRDLPGGNTLTTGHPCDGKLTATHNDGTSGVYPCTLPYGHMGAHEMVRRSPDLAHLINDRDRLLAAARAVLVAYDSDPPTVGEWHTRLDQAIESLREAAAP